ncbi:hypothetical protein JOF53_004823 [Crossiella equi]|uniref:ABC3 transporter permease C-terminal domain-containing protein n=1 Tax=Crossiella equi TaxID=130796 RepID=A0ABS5AHA6_9PSEU|nr:ABC transporter permease [Crossiella equi]MBP2475951.1 hypothetical protein [Crossiella equi]
MTQRSSVDEVRIGQWLRELLFGTRLALTGGRAAWARLALSAVGIGLGVMVLLLVASVGNAERGQNERVAARSLEMKNEPVLGPKLYARDVGQYWRGAYIAGIELAAEGGSPQLPPGLAAVPGPGELVVSPALDRLLREPRNELLRARLPERIVGTVGDEGLEQPAELFFYAGMPEGHRAAAGLVTRIGAPGYPGPELPELFRLLITAAAAALLVPIGVFVLVATQIGAGAREQRLASLRLVGASVGQARRVAAGESLAAALLGLAVGGGLFAGGRLFAARVEVAQVSFFPADIVPDAPVTALLLVGVPVTAVTAALFGLRRLEIGPLGVVRRAEPPRRRLGWRLVPPALGVALLVAFGLMEGYSARWVSDWRGTVLSVGIGLVLAGTAAALPWLVERLADHWSPPWVAALVAVRRLRFEYATTRVVAGVVTVLVGAVALQVLLATVYAEDEYGGRPVNTSGDVLLYSTHDEDEDPASVLAAIASVPGVRHTGLVRARYSHPVGEFQVLACPVLRELYGVVDCRPGDGFLTTLRGSQSQVRAGEVVWFTGRENQTGFAFTVPPLRPVPERPQRLGSTPAVVIAEGGDPRMDALQIKYYWLRGETGPDLTDRVLAAVAKVDLGIRPVDPPGRNEQAANAFQAVRGLVLAGSFVVVLLAVLSLVVAAIDQLQERRRQYSVLAASGVPRRTLAWAALWQNAVPTAVGLVLALPTGLGLAQLVLQVLGGTGGLLSGIVVNWGDVGMTLGAGAALTVLVTLLTLPALRSAVRPSGLRFE